MKTPMTFLSLIITLACLPAHAEFRLPPPPPGFGQQGPGRPDFGRPDFGHPDQGRGDFLRPGDIAWTDSGMQVQVQAVFPNGQVSVVYNTVNFTFNRSQLAVRGCNASLCSGNPAITDSGMNVTVNGFFQNGDASVVYNTVNFRFRAEQLASARPPWHPEPPQFGEIRLGDTVWTDSGMEGQVTGLFQDGRVNVVYNTVNFQFQRAQLASRSCLGNICSGNNVITRSGMNAVVNGFFNDNRRVSVKFNTVNFVFDYSELAKTF